MLCAVQSILCKHFRKALSPKQVEAHQVARKSRHPLTAGLRDKKTNCPSKITLTVNIPTKKQTRLADSHPYFISHKTTVKLDFCHNHPVHAAHSLSFQPVAEATKDKMYVLFSKGHSAASARHAHETEIMLQCAEDGKDAQAVLADIAINPNVQDYSRLYNKWRAQ